MNCTKLTAALIANSLLFASSNAFLSFFVRPVFRDSQVEFLERKKDNAAYDLRKLRGDKRSDTQQTFCFSIPWALWQLEVDIFDVALAR